MSSDAIISKINIITNKCVRFVRKLLDDVNVVVDSDGADIYFYFFGG